MTEMTRLLLERIDREHPGAVDNLRARAAMLPSNWSKATRQHPGMTKTVVAEWRKIGSKAARRLRRMGLRPPER